MTTLYQFIEGETGAAIAENEWSAQPGPPYGIRPILIAILNLLADPVALNLSAIVASPQVSEIGYPSVHLSIPTPKLAPQRVGQTVGYLLQWMMKEWSGGFTSMATDGNLISILSD